MLTGGFERSEGVMFLQFTSRFQQSAQVTAWPAAMCSTIRLLMGPVATAVSNRLSVRASVMAGSLVWGFALLLSGYAADNIAAIFFTYGLLQGIGRGLVYTPSVIAVGLYFHRRQGLGVGLGSAGVGLGTLLMPPLQEWLFHQLDFGGAFLVLAGVALNGCVVAALYRPLFLHRSIVLRRGLRRSRKATDEEEALYSTSQKSNSHQMPRKEAAEQVCLLMTDAVPHPETKTETAKDTRDPRDDHQTTTQDDAAITENTLQDRSQETPPPASNAHQPKQSACQTTTSCHHVEQRQIEQRQIEQRQIEQEQIEQEQIGHEQKQEQIEQKQEQIEQKQEQIEQKQEQIEQTQEQIEQTQEQIEQTQEQIKEQIEQKQEQIEQTQEQIEQKQIKAHIEQKQEQIEQINQKQKPSQCASCLKSLLRTCFPIEEQANDSPRRQLIEWSLLKTPPFLFYCLSISLFTAAFKSAFTFLPALAQSKGMSSTQGAYLLSIAGSLDIVGRVLSGFLLDMKGVRPLRPLVYNGVIFVIVALSMVSPLLGAFWQLAVLFGLYGMLTGTYVAQKSVILVDILGRDRLSSSFGLLICFQGLGSMVGPPLSGLLKDVFGRFDEAFYLGGSAMALSGILMIVSNIYRLRSKSSTPC